MSLLQRVSEGPRTFWRVQGLGDFPELHLAQTAAEKAGLCLRWGDVFPAGECARLGQACRTRRCQP